MKLGEAMYKAQQQDNNQPENDPGQPGADSDKKNEKVVDAEFEEVKDDTKQA